MNNGIIVIAHLRGNINRMPGDDRQIDVSVPGGTYISPK